MRKFLTKFLREESGAAAVEYGLLVGLISIVAVASITAVGAALIPIYNAASTALVGAL